MLIKHELIEFFRYNNIDTIFHLPGIHTLSLNESLFKSNINNFIGRHENNIVAMADGYARTSGKVGFVIVTPGPGLGNTVSGCLEAFNDDIPLVILHVDTGREEIGKGILHELIEPESIFTNFTKKTFVIAKTADVIPVFEEAYKTTNSDRKGPVLISMPYMFFDKEMPREEGFKRSRGRGIETKGQRVTDFNLSKLEEILHWKKKPVIIGGKSLMFEEARSVLDNICMNSSMPFLTTTGGKGIVNEKNVYSFGNIMQRNIAREILSSSDIVIAIGTRLRDVDAKRRGIKVKDLIHIDIDNKWIGKNYSAMLEITGDIKQIPGQLSQILNKRKFEWNVEELKETHSNSLKEIEKLSPGLSLVNIIRNSIPDDTITVCDLNFPSYYAEYYFPVYHQRTFIMPRGISPIFYSLPAAIGAKIGRPDRPCLAICGDGGILPVIGELATIAKYSIPVVVFVHNNNSFGILEDVMNNNYGINGSMSLKNPDYCKLASAFGIKSTTTKSLEGLKRIFLRNITWDEPFLIEFNCPVFPPPWKL